MDSDDQNLIKRTLSGDTDAFDQLVLKHQDRLYRTLVHMLGSVHDARDVTQDAFLLAYQKLDTFRQEASFYSWLFRIAYHAAISRRRKNRQIHQSLEGRREQTGIDLPDRSPASDPTEHLNREEQQELVRTALNQLPPDYRDVLTLKELEGFSYDEIASILGCPIGTVRSRIHRGREELREKLSRALEREGE